MEALGEQLHMIRYITVVTRYPVLCSEFNMPDSGRSRQSFHSPPHEHGSSKGARQSTVLINSVLLDSMCTFAKKGAQVRYLLQTSEDPQFHQQDMLATNPKRSISWRRWSGFTELNHLDRKLPTGANSLQTESHTHRSEGLSLRLSC